MSAGPCNFVDVFHSGQLHVYQPLWLKCCFCPFTTCQGGPCWRVWNPQARMRGSVHLRLCSFPARLPPAATPWTASPALSGALPPVSQPRGPVSAPLDLAGLSSECYSVTSPCHQCRPCRGTASGALTLPARPCPLQRARLPAGARCPAPGSLSHLRVLSRRPSLSSGVWLVTLRREPGPVFSPACRRGHSRLHFPTRLNLVAKS